MHNRFDKVRQKDRITTAYHLNGKIESTRIFTLEGPFCRDKARSKRARSFGCARQGGENPEQLY